MLGLTFVLSLAPEAPLTFSHMYAIDLCKNFQSCSSFVYVHVVTNKLSQELSYFIIFKLHAVCTTIDTCSCLPSQNITASSNPRKSATCTVHVPPLKSRACALR